MNWSYGITTVPDRVANGLLKRTMESLATAGFDRPMVFVDGPLSYVPEYLRGLKITERPRNLRTFGNWMLSAWEIYLQDPEADRFAVFQDDFVTVQHLREYLESCDYPDHGYLNLYTFPENERELNGWYLSNQLGKGAVALVFSNEAIRTILSSRHMVDRPLNPRRGWRSVDGGIVTGFKKQDWKEYVHNPSLVQHTGLQSSMGNRKHELASTFPGEDFDARTLIPTTQTVAVRPSRKECRIGLVGYNCASGIGELNRQLSEYIDIKAWLVIPHRHHQMQPFPAGVEILVHKEERHIDEFLKRVDAVVFAETPFYESIVHKARAQGKRTICVPMQEWLPTDCKGWPQQTDLFVCPTTQCYQKFHRQLPCVMFPWPFDTNRFIFRQRETCERFLFINGHGGWNGRKGEHVVAKAKNLWPEMPLIVRSQKNVNLSGVDVLPSTESNSDLYTEGDVLLMPHSVDGIGLELLEAMSSGMPVVATDGEPWNEHPLIGRIESQVEQRKIRSLVDWYLPSPKSLVEICQRLLHQDISEQSRDARIYAEQNRWQGRVAELTELIVTGQHNVSIPFTPKDSAVCH